LEKHSVICVFHPAALATSKLWNRAVSARRRAMSRWASPLTGSARTAAVCEWSSAPTAFTGAGSRHAAAAMRAIHSDLLVFEADI
jgi:hypothetical protein